MDHEPDTIVICADCCLPVGPFRDPDGQILDVLDCDCHRISSFTTAALPDHDSIWRWEKLGGRCRRSILCRGCGAAWLRDSGRFRGWFCTECALIVRGINTALQRPLIPLGRHSFVNIVPTTGQWTVVPTARKCAGIITTAERERATGRKTSRKGRPAALSLWEHLAHAPQLDQLRGHVAGEVRRTIDATPAASLTRHAGDYPLAAYLEWASQFHGPCGPAIVRLARGWTAGIAQWQR